ncbi:MAG TPA: alpha/beta hydrolase [Acidimicrobiales bacterium]|nr:alpha/beta hydrolase [Acidimicrobiales bacterium]
MSHDTTDTRVGPPTAEHRVDLPDGRTATAAEYGDPAGPVVVLCHAAPGSSHLDPDPAATAAAGVRLVSVDRPGYGGSTPLGAGTAPTITGFADDLAAVLAALGLGEVAVAGWSAGGRVALALAARHPAVVRAVAVVATPAPHEEVPWIPAEHAAMLDQLRADPGGATAALAPAFGEVVGAPRDARVATVATGPADAAVLAADPAAGARLAGMLDVAFAQGALGMAADIVSYTVVPWGFDPSAVGAPTTAFYGADDVIVPPAHGEWYVARVPGASLRVVAGAGHLVALAAWGEILEALA